MEKKKISDKQFLLIVNGPSCGGKSSVSNILCDIYGGIFHAKSDTIKWLITDYTPHVHRSLVSQMTFALARIAIAEGLSIVKEGAHYEPEKYITLAKEVGIPVFILNIEAPWEVLVERFQQRIEAKKQGAKKIANVDPLRFKELFDEYHKTKMETPLEFDSTKQTPEEIAKEIAKYIKEKLK